MNRNYTIIQDMIKAICELAQKQNISFESLNDDKNKAGLIVEIVNLTLRTAKDTGYDFAWKAGVYYIYCGSHWMQISLKEVSILLSVIAKIGKIHAHTAEHHRFRSEVVSQFKAAVRDLKSQPSQSVKINCGNGTLVFDASGVSLQPFKKEDNFMYVLNYNYNPEAKALLFQRVLDEALPIDGQIMLQEYIASAFLPKFNHERVLFLYGVGANSKSVIIKIISAALGRDNIVNRSLESICSEESRTVCDLEERLLNICSEMSSRFNIENFKKIASKEPITARRLYGEPYTIYNYASLLFSCNELPKNIEFTHGYFRRLMILPFLNIIPEEKQDRTLAYRIISSEIQGVLNWIINGVRRLLAQGKFSKCEIAEKAMEQYKIEADSVASFLADSNYHKSLNNTIALKELFSEYLKYCKESNCHACALKTFSTRLKLAGIDVTRRAQGMVVHIKCIPLTIETPKVVSSVMSELSVDDFFGNSKEDIGKVNEIPSSVPSDEIDVVIADIE